MKTIIEAGHYYEVNGPSMLSMQGWDIAKQYAEAAENPALVLFVDDYHEEQAFLEQGDSFLPADASALAAQQLAGQADAVFYEATLAESAPARVQTLLDDGLVKLKKGVVSAGGVRLGCLRRA